MDQYENMVVMWNNGGTNNAYLAFYQKGESTSYLETNGLGSSDAGEVPGLYINRAQIEKGIGIWANLTKSNVISQPFFIYNPGVGLIYQLNQGPVHYQ